MLLVVRTEYLRKALSMRLSKRLRKSSSIVVRHSQSVIYWECGWLAKDFHFGCEALDVECDNELPMLLNGGIFHVSEGMK